MPDAGPDPTPAQRRAGRIAAETTRIAEPETPFERKLRQLSLLRANRDAKIERLSERVRQEWLAYSSFDPLMVMRADGGLRKLNEIPAHARRCISSMKIRTEVGAKDGARSVITDVRFVDRRAVLADLAKHLGMMVERHANPDGSAMAAPVVNVYLHDSATGE